MRTNLTSTLNLFNLSSFIDTNIDPSESFELEIGELFGQLGRFQVVEHQGDLLLTLGVHGGGRILAGH